VLDWLPADRPGHSRVRLLDFTDGKLHPLLTRDKTSVPAGAEEQMQGRGRQAVYSPDRQTLYTLYTHQPEHQHTRNLLNGTRSHVHAFVHVLHLAERWAYCLDLPDPFGQGPAEGHALAVDGTRLAVLDTASGSIAHANTETLQIERVARMAAGRGAASLVFSPDARLLAADGATVHALDRTTDQTLATWVLPSAVRGLRLSADGSRLYAGSENGVVWLDAGSGALRGRRPLHRHDQRSHQPIIRRKLMVDGSWTRSQDGSNDDRRSRDGGRLPPAFRRHTPPKPTKVSSP
jgi:hypothetical protein